MPNIGKVLKEEIVRLAKKQAKAALSPIRQPAAAARHAIASLTRRVTALEKTTGQLRRQLDKAAALAPTATAEPAVRVRITAKGLRSLRHHLRLTAADLAKLLGVTQYAVYAWEAKQGPVRLRKSTRSALLAIRGIGAREARQRIAALAAARKQAK